MKLRTVTISLGLALSALASALTFAAAASAVRPPEPALGSPVSQQQPRTPAAKKVKKAVKRNWGGYPKNGNTHVRSLFAPEDP